MNWLRAGLLVLSGLAFGGGALAQAPSQSLRPMPRETGTDQPISRTQVSKRGVVVRIGADIRPRPRPGKTVKIVRTRVAATTPGLARSPQPKKRPRNLLKRFERKAASPAVVAKRQPKKGSVCGDRSIRGQIATPVAGRLKGCGIASPVRVTEVSGVKLSQASLMDCTTAQALKSWIDKGVKPAVGKQGGGVASLRIVAHYQCRTRNHRPGAKISEHGKGRAIDIAGIRLKNGHEMSVLRGWRGQDSTALKQMHKAACGPFGTVLGPNADRHHQDHFHFDTARYRSGTYCR